MVGLAITVDVPGTPIAQGSTRSFERAGRTFTKSSNAGPLERWRGDIRTALRGQEPDVPVRDPISIRLSFRMPRPASHFLPANSKRPEPVLREDAPHWVVGGKDVDKLVRAVLDAMTGLVYVDDGQVVSIVAAKRYPGPGESVGLRLELATTPRPGFTTVPTSADSAAAPSLGLVP